MSEQDFGQRLKQDIEERVRDQVRDSMRRPKVMLVGDFRWGLLWGAIIVLIGVGLLLDHMGIAPFDRLYRFWPMILVLFGVMNFVSGSNRGFGIVLVAAGSLLQLNKLGILHLTFDQLWPLAIIAVGLLVMWGSLETRGFLREKVNAIKDFRDQVTGSGDPMLFNAVAVFGGCERRVTGKNFQGGKATAVFGGIELDFRDADMESEAILEINCVFGGVEVRVPETWHVYSRNIPVFGGFEDTTRQASVAPGAQAKTLTITGMVVFGGVEIKN